jgi:hypothetical protein
VVRNERRQTTENRAYGIVDGRDFMPCFSGPSVPPEIIGSHEDIQARLPMRDFFKRYYRPNNATCHLVTSRRLPRSAWSKAVRSFNVAPIPPPAVKTPP